VTPAAPPDPLPRLTHTAQVFAVADSRPGNAEVTPAEIAPAEVVSAREIAPVAEVAPTRLEVVAPPAAPNESEAQAAPTAPVAAQQEEAAPTPALEAASAIGAEPPAAAEAETGIEEARAEAEQPEAPTVAETEAPAIAADAEKPASPEVDDAAPTLLRAPKITLPPPPTAPSTSAQVLAASEGEAQAARFASAASEIPVALSAPPPPPRPSRLARAQALAERAWSARQRVARRAQSWVPRAKELGARAAERALPRARRMLRPAQRAVPRVAAWAGKNLRSTPRALVAAAPFVALLLIWLGHRVTTHSKHAATQHVALGAPQTAPEARGLGVEASPIAASVITQTRNASPAPVAAADDAELRAAIAQGLPAMEALAAKYAADPQVLLALAHAEAQAQRYEAAVSAVDRALDAEPSTAQTGKIMSILWRAAQSPASDAAFAALRKLGARGSDVELDLAVTPGVRESVRERAKTELMSALALDASLDTRTATALLTAPDCAAKKALLGRAEQDGGKRTRAVLELIARGADCAPAAGADCNACFNGSAELSQAINKLSVGAKP